MAPALAAACLFVLGTALAFLLLDRRSRRLLLRERMAHVLRPVVLEADTLPEEPERSPRSVISQLMRWAGREKRRRAFVAQIPDALLLISSALRAGHSPSRAVQLAAEEMPAPLSEEFSLALGEISLGLTTANALARISGRIASPDWELVVTALSVQAQTGGNLAELLEHIATTIRERARVRGEVETLTAEGKLSAAILVLLPPILALLLTLRSPAYFAPLLAAPVGHLLIFAAVAGQLLGMLTLRKMLKLDI